MAVFWANPYNNFILFVLNSILERLEKYKIIEDYDVLFVTGNAMISEIYDIYPDKDSIELVSLEQTRKMFEPLSNGSWRKDK